MLRDSRLAYLLSHDSEDRDGGDVSLLTPDAAPRLQGGERGASLPAHHPSPRLHGAAPDGSRAARLAPHVSPRPQSSASRRSRRQHDEHANHERWLVSYADFITLLFAFFVVMYAISQVNEGKYRLLSDALVQAFKPEVGPPRPVAPDAKSPDPGASAGELDAGLQAVARDLIKALDPLVKGGQVRVTESGLGVAVEINASLLFASAEASLQEEALPVLGEVAKVLAPLTNDVQVEGHTDDQAISTRYFVSNWELSGARASSVVRLFIAAGVAPVRLAAVGYADTRNIAPNTTLEGRAENRRVTVMILPEKKRGRGQREGERRAR